MSFINISGLTFGYDGSYENIFENLSVFLDTDWRLGFIGRNGRGKTTLLRLLEGLYPYSGTIDSSVNFCYFPFSVENEHWNTLTVVRSIIAPFDEWERQMQECAESGDERLLLRYGDILEEYTARDGFIINELIERELGKLRVKADVLSRPFASLSGGEKTKLMLAALFLRKDSFSLIDEPTNHLDLLGREAVSAYLAQQKGFILVSHDRAFLDGCIDHVLSLNRGGIEVQRGTYSSWKENLDRKNAQELAQNESLKKDIARLEAARDTTARWSDRVEKTKIGQRVSGVKPDRGHIGHQAAKLMKRARAIEHRRDEAAREKSTLLKNLEESEPLKLTILTHHAPRLVEAEGLTIAYGDQPLFEPVSFTISSGQRLAVKGANGSGKSSLLKLVCGEDIPHRGRLSLASGLVISYVSQDTSHLRGGLREFAGQEGVDESLFLAILRKLDFARSQFEKDMAQFSAGQKKKVLLAKSLAQKAHLYVWDEPLNYVDVLSRIQLEELLAAYCPAMLLVEHDAVFLSNIADKVLELHNYF